MNDLERAIEIAEHDYDGHLTIMRFTTGWKAMFGTPDLDNGFGRQQLWEIPTHASMDAALRYAIEQE